jgi:hypothetical protein
MHAWVGRRGDGRCRPTDGGHGSGDRGESRRRDAGPMSRRPLGRRFSHLPARRPIPFHRHHWHRWTYACRVPASALRWHPWTCACRARANALRWRRLTCAYRAMVCSQRWRPYLCVFLGSGSSRRSRPCGCVCQPRWNAWHWRRSRRVSIHGSMTARPRALHVAAQRWSQRARLPSSPRHRGGRRRWLS